MAANNPFFGNPMDKVTEERRAKRYELPDFSKIGEGGRVSAPSLDVSRMPAGSLLPPPELEPLFVGAAQQYQVPANVLMALGQQESSYNPGAIGQETKWGRAKGLMQYIDDTAQGMGIDAMNPAQSVDAAAKQFQQRIAKGYSVEEAIMAHHGGDDRSQWGPKTRKYLRDVTQKALAIREQWQALQAEQPKGMTRDAVKSAEEVAAAANQPPPAVEAPSLDPSTKVQGDEFSAAQVEKMREKAEKPGEFDALTGADIKTGKTDTPLDLVRRGLSAVNDVLQTPATEFDILTRTPEGPSGEAKPKGGILGDVTGSIAEATQDPADFTGEYERDHAAQIDAFTGAAPKVDDKTWTGWVKNLIKSTISGTVSSVGQTAEGVGIITQQMANVEADRQVQARAKALDGARTNLGRVLEANKGQPDQVTMQRAQGIAENLAQREIEFHKSVVDWAQREPDKVAGWFRSLGVDMGKLAETLQADPAYKGITTDIASGLGSMLTYMGPGFVTTLMTRGSTAAVRAAAGIAGASALAGPAGAADAYQRAIEFGLPEREALHIAMVGIPGGIVQVAPIAVILQRIPQGVRGKAVAQFRHLLESFGAEFVAEGAGVVFQNLVEKSYNAEQGVWDDSLYQAAIGGSSAALISLGVQIATRGKGIGPIDAGDLGRALDENIRKGEWNTTPEMEAMRIMDPQAYMATIMERVEQVAPDAVLAGDLGQPEGPAPAGPIERAAAETAREQAVEQVPGERVSIQTITGKLSGTVEDYFEDGEGGFQVQILSDEGEQYVFDQSSQVVITRDEILEEALGESATTEEAPKAGEKTEEKTSPPEEAPSEQDEAIRRHAERTQKRIGFLSIAESEQDIDDLISAETEDKEGVATEARQQFLDAAEQRRQELQGAATESQAKTETRVEAPAAAKAPETTAAGEPIVEHITQRGKVKRGVVRDIPKAEATAIDTYAFQKDGGWFINLQRLDAEQQGKPIEAEGPDTENEQVVTQDTEANPLEFKSDGNPFASYERAAKAAKNRNITGTPVQVDGGWAIQPDGSQAAQARVDGAQAYADRRERQVPREFNVSKPIRQAWYEAYDQASAQTEPLPAPGNPNPRAVAGSDAYQKRVDDWKARLQQADSVQELESIRAEIWADPERTATSDFLLSTVAVGRWQDLYEQAPRGQKPAKMRSYPTSGETEPKEATDATEIRKESESDLGEHQDRESGGETAGTGRSDSTGQGQAEQEKGPEEVAQQYQSAVEAEIKREKARMMRLRKGAASAEGRKKLTASEARLRNLRNIVFSEPPEGWAPGAPVIAEPKPDTSRTPPIADARREDKKRDLHQQGRETALAGETREVPEWIAGDTELENAWIRGWNEGMSQRGEDTQISVREESQKEERDKIKEYLRLQGAISPDQVTPGTLGGETLQTERPFVAKGHIAIGIKGRQYPIKELLDEIAAEKPVEATDTTTEPVEEPAKDRQVSEGTKATKPAVSTNKIFTEDAAAAARERLRKRLGNLNTGIDPEMMIDGITLAGYHIEKGARTFAAYAKAMIDDLGPAAKPYLKSWYAGISYDPRAQGFDGMTPIAEMDSIDVDAVLGEAGDAGLGQPSADSVAVVARLLGNLSQGQALVEQGFDALDVADQKRVLSEVGSAIENLEVLGAVVESVPVDVMNMLIGPDVAAENLAGDPAVLKNALFVDGNKPVPTGVVGVIDALVSVVREGAIPSAVGSSARRDSLVATGEGDTAVAAGESDQGNRSSVGVEGSVPQGETPSDTDANRTDTDTLEGAQVTPEEERQRLKDRQEELRAAKAAEEATPREQAWADLKFQYVEQELTEQESEARAKFDYQSPSGNLSPQERMEYRLGKIRAVSSGEISEQDLRFADMVRQDQAADTEASGEQDSTVAMAREFVRRKYNVQEQNRARARGEGRDEAEANNTVDNFPEPEPRPTDDVLRPEGKMPRWRTENAATKYRDDRDLLGIYEVEAEDKGFILRRLPTFTLEVSEHRYESQTFGGETSETVLLRPEGMSLDLFKALVDKKLRVKPSQIIKNGAMVKAHSDKIRRLADHLEATITDKRDPEIVIEYPIRGGSTDDTQGDSTAGTQPLVDTAPESTLPADSGADPERVDGIRPSSEAGDGQPDSDRSRREDGLERGEVAGSGGPADTGGSLVGAGNRPPASDPLNRKDDRPHTLAGENPGNFVIPDDFNLGAGTEGQKIANNLAALEVMLRANAEGRFATQNEQKILARYVGWGGLDAIFKPKNIGTTNQYGRAHAWLKENLTKEQFAAAKRSIQDAHYTSDKVVGMMWKAARYFGFKGGRVLEPTVGVGNFLGLQPTDLAGASEWHAAELDQVSGQIAQLLYPNANILSGTGFQAAPFADGVMDLSIGNPPFGSQPISDTSKRRSHLDGMKIHNYIIAKAGMHLRPGGVMQMVVTHRFLDTADPEGRSEIAKHFRLLGAVRLPNDAFSENAGTSVTTDLVFLQKLREGERPDTGASWLDTEGEIEVDGVKLRVNRYYQENPQNILGKSTLGGSMYRGQGQEYTVESDGRDIEADFDKIVAEGSLAGLADIMEKTVIDQDGQAVMIEKSDLPVGGMTLTPEGKIILRDLDDAAGNSVIIEVTPDTFWKEQAAQWEEALDAVKSIKETAEAGGRPSPKQVLDLEEAAQVATMASGNRKPKPTKAEQGIYDLLDFVANPVGPWRFDDGLAAMEATLERKKLGRKGYDTLRKLLDLRNRALNLLYAERTNNPAMENLRKDLNQAYDAFVKNYGLISNPSNLSLLAGDVGIEIGLEIKYQPEIKPAEAKEMGVAPTKAKAEKADIFERRVTWPEKVIERADNVIDGMSISLSQKGRLDTAYIADLVGKPQSEVIRELLEAEAIFYDSEQFDYVTAEEYLSGNVKHKLQVAIENGEDNNAEALEKVQPEPKTQKQITPSIRGTWIPTAIFEDFLSALGLKKPHVLVQPGIGRVSAREAVGEASELGLQFSDPDASMVQIFNAAASGKSMRIMRKDGDTTYEDKGASQRVTAKAERMAKVFMEWAYSDGDRADVVIDAYNRAMNTHRQRTYNGEKYLKPVGQSPSVKLRRTQKNAAWRMIQSNAVLTDHVVGSGKTMTLITGIMERRRLGLSRKPAIVVPNHLVVQWASEFYQLYPGARILAATPDDFAKKNRRRLFARIATGDYDAIIMGHSSFGFIEPPDADVRSVIAESKEKLEKAMEEAAAAGESGRTLKQMQKKLDTYDDRLQRLAERARDEMGFDFEGMGIDYLAVDEAHMFKNLEYATSGERVVGMNDPKGSSRAFDLFTKMRGLQKRGGGITFATGTPVSNSLVELYTMMRYLAPDSLKDRDQDHFDAWAGAYAVTETRMEYTATQKLKPRRVLSGLANLDGLGQLYREFADIVTMDDLKRIYSEEKRESNAATGANERTEFPVPKVKHGGRQLDTGDITDQQSEYMDYLVARMQAIEANKRDPEYARIDNPLWVLGDARKMSLDIRVVDPTASRDENGKVMRSARKIKDLYDRWDADKGTQMVFSDLSTPAKTSGAAARKIVKSGLEVVFGETEAKKAVKRIKDMSLREQWKYVQQAAEQVMEDPAISGEKAEKIEAFLEENSFADSTMQVADTGFSVYDDLREVLTDMGIPSHEIAFIHDYNTPEQKSRLFARVNAGTIRVLIGSTEKMGAGTNAQERLVGLHHLDAPWRPSDVEQREGRIIRQGNELYKRDPDNFEVEINAYSTNGTSDTVMWQVLERKAGAIEQFRQAGLDSMQEDGADSDQYAEFMATSTGNPVFTLKLEAERDMTNVEAEVGGKAIAVQNAKSFMENYPGRVDYYNERISGLEAMETGDIVFNGETGSYEGYQEAMEAAEERYKEEDAAFGIEYARVHSEREALKAEGKKKLPAYPVGPLVPTIFSPQVLEASAYARLVKAALEDVAAGSMREGRIVPVKMGNANLEIERRIRHSGNAAYFVNLKLPGGFHTNVAVSEAKNPVDAPNLVNALTPKAIERVIKSETESARRGLADLENKVERESGLAKQEVSEQPITEAQTLLDWYRDQVKIAEYEADIKRGERKNRYIASDGRRPLDQFKARGEVESKHFTVNGETFTTTGLAAVEGYNSGSRTIHDARRDSDDRKALVYEVKENQSSEPVISAVLEPEKARELRRSATAQSNARKRTRKPTMSALEANQRIRQGRLGEAAGKLLDTGKIRIVSSTPGDVPVSTAAYVDENGIINLVARNLDPQRAETTLLHEAFHAGARPLIGSRRWDDLQERLGRLHRQAELSTGYNHQFWEAARARIAEAEAAGDVMDNKRRVEEFGAYALEEFAASPPSLRKWASELVGLVKAWLQRMFGIQAGEVTPAQLRALAAAALRNGDMAPSPSFDIGAPELVHSDGTPVTEAERKAEVERAARKGIKALSVARGNGVVDKDGGLTRDIGKISTVWHQPYSIASMEPQFTPVFRTAVAQHRFRDTIISEMYPKFRTYKELRKEGRDRVNKVLELGRLAGVSYSDARLRYGVENRGFKRVIYYDANGVPTRRAEPLHTALSSRGDVIRLTAEERTAYLELRSMFDEALDLFRDQTLVDLGMDQFVGVTDPAAAIMAAITPNMSARMQERYENIAKMAEEIDQAKRTGYVPFNRYGRFVITVREKIANVRYTRIPSGGYIAHGVPVDLTDFMNRIGASWNPIEDGWEINDAQKRQLGRETTRTVYSEKLDPESYADRWETHRGSKKRIKPKYLSFIQERMAAIEAEWGGPGRKIRAIDTKKARVEGGLKLSDVDTLADLAQVDNDTWNGIRDDFVKAMRGRGFRKHFFRAENVPGYDLDFEKGIADYIGSISGYLSRRHHEKDWDKAVGAVKGPVLNEYSKDYRNYINDPAEEFALLRQTGFLFYIAGNVSTALLNATQVPIMTMPALTQVMGHAKAARHVAGAYKDALAMTSLYDQAREGWQRGGIRGSVDMMLQMFDPNDAPADVRAEVLEAWDDGMFTPQFTHEVMGFSGRKDNSASAMLEKSIDYIASSYTYIERLNRLVTFIAAVRAARDPAVQAKAETALAGNALARMTILGSNWSHKAFGEFIVDESQFLMGKVNRAKMLRGAGSVVFQFMSFVLNSLQAWMRWSTINGGSGKMATAYSIGAIVALSGVWGAPGLEYLRKGFEWLWGKFIGEDEDLRYNLREWVSRTSGQDWLGELVDKGALYPLGMDMSGRLGFQRMLPDVSSPVAALGIPADLLLMRPYRAAEHALKGEPVKAIGELSPNFVKNPITAREWHDKGVRTRSGNQVLTPDQIPTSALWWKAFGIQPSIVSDAYEYRFAKSRAQRGAGVKHKRTIDQIASAMAELDRNTDPARIPELEARLDRLYKDVEEHNEANPETALDPARLVQRVQSRLYEYLHGPEMDLMRGDPATRERMGRMMEVYNIDDTLGSEEPKTP